MPVTEVTGDGAALTAAIAKAKGALVVLDVYATWCGPCRAIAPFVEQLSSQHPDVVFLKFNEASDQEEVQRRGVRGYPCFHFYINSSKVHEVMGADARALTEGVERFKKQATPAAAASFSGAGMSLAGAGGGGGAGAGIGTGDAAAVRAARLARLGAPGGGAAAPGAAAAAPAAPAAPAAVSQGDVDTLMSMGFGEAISRAALAATGAVEASLDWIERHQDDAAFKSGAGPAAAPAASSSSSGGAPAAPGPGAAAAAREAAAGGAGGDGALDMMSEEVQEAIAEHDAAQASAGGECLAMGRQPS
jgi:thiol-disulfide isomerase/thioredoxin